MHKVNSATRSSKGTKLPGAGSTMPYASRRPPGVGSRGYSQMNNKKISSKANLRASSNSAISARSNKSAISQKSARSGKSGVSRHSSAFSSTSGRKNYMQPMRSGGMVSQHFGRKAESIENTLPERNSRNHILDHKKISNQRETANHTTNTAKFSVHQARKMSSPRLSTKHDQ